MRKVTRGPLGFRFQKDETWDTDQSCARVACIAIFISIQVVKNCTELVQAVKILASGKSLFPEECTTFL